MSRQFRYRVAAIVLSGLVFGAPLLAIGTARAQQVQERGRQVTFQGDSMLGLSCRSRPDTESMVVPANSMVRVINRTGYTAKLQLGDPTKRTLADSAATEVMFRRGTTAVRLKPNCPLRADARPVRVTTTPSEPTKAQPTNTHSTQAATNPGPTALAIVPSDSVAPSRAVSGLPKHVAPSDHSPGLPKGTHRPHAPRIAPTGTRSTPRDGAVVGTKPKIRAKIRTRTRPLTPGSRAPAYAGMPPGDARTLTPRVPGTGLVPLSREAVPAPALPPATDVAAAEPMATGQPLPDSRPVGLLALIAVVCVMGVGAAAIRSIVSQRANRSKIA